MNQLLLLPGTNAWAFGLSIGLVLAILVLGVYFVSRVVADPLRRRLKNVASSSDKPENFLSRIGERLMPKEEETQSALAALMIQAGWRQPHGPAVVYSIKAILAVLLPLAGVVILLSVPQLAQKQGNLQLLALPCLAIIGWWLPSYIVRRAAEARQERLLEAFPDALDLLVACTEAGLGLNAAIERVAEQLPASSPDLAFEFQLINSETRAGVDRVVALKNLATRTGLADIRGLVSLIIHSMRFGTSIATTLRTYADEFRDKRLQRAEEAAATVGTKLIFPLVLCIFPSFFIVAIGPAMVGVFKAFGVR